MKRRAFLTGLVAGSAAQGLRGAAALLKVHFDGGIHDIDMEQYTASVLSGEASVFRSDEGLKAMAVAVRTYAARFRGRHAAEGYDLCGTTHCQRFNATPPSKRVMAAAQQTAGQTLTYGGQPALSYYSLDCGGHTEDVRQAWPGEVAPYLNSHADPYCQRSARGKWHWEIPAPELGAALRNAGLQAPPVLERISIVTRVPASGRAAIIELHSGTHSIRLSASSLRFAVGRAYGFNTIQNDLYRVGAAGGRLVFDGRGAGHGVGLCQRGADQMGIEGRSYRDILTFYFPGTVLGGDEQTSFAWRRVSGERVAMFTTQPDQDRPILVAAERLLRSLELRTRMVAPGGITIRAYPTVAAFIAATGEPGWIAAQVAHGEIHLQPRRTLDQRHALESTLKHELAHVLIDAKARPGLPVWFREGLAEYLSNTGGTSTGEHAVPDRDLRQTADEPRARAAYREARTRVSASVTRYGETAVLGWIAAGLPNETTRANSRPPATRSK